MVVLSGLSRVVYLYLLSFDFGVDCDELLLLLTHLSLENVDWDIFFLRGEVGVLVDEIKDGAPALSINVPRLLVELL